MKKPIKNPLHLLHEKYIQHLERRLHSKKKILDLKSEIQKNSHSIFWVWEFSKKAVLICFAFYVITQIYAMTVMVLYKDFTYLGEMITQASDIVTNCVFGYLVKSGIENVFKIRRNNTDEDNNEPMG